MFCENSQLVQIKVYTEQITIYNLYKHIAQLFNYESNK